MTEEYLNYERDQLMSMRLLAEGAMELFNGDVQPLFSLSVKNDVLQASVALDAIGAALTDLVKCIRELQMENMQQRRIPQSPKY